MRGAGMRIEHHEVATPAPSEFFTRKQIFDLVGLGDVDLKTFNRNIGKSALGVIWIEIDHHQDDIVESLRRLGIEQYLFVFDGMESEIFILAQSAVMTPDRVELGDVILNVAGRVPIPFFELVFFRIEIFFFPGNSDIFA